MKINNALPKELWIICNGRNNFGRGTEFKLATRALRPLNILFTNYNGKIFIGRKHYFQCYLQKQTTKTHAMNL